MKKRREKKKLTDDKDEITAEEKRVSGNIPESVVVVVITLEVTSPGCLTTGGPPSPGKSGGSAFGFALRRACARPHR